MSSILFLAVGIVHAATFTPSDGGVGSGVAMSIHEVSPLLDREDVEWETFIDWPTSPAGFALGPHPFIGAIIIGDYLWCSPYTSTSFLRVHRSTGQMSDFKVKTSSAAFGRGSSYDEGNNRLWITRSNGPVLALDLNTGTSQEYNNFPANAGLTSQWNFFGGFVDAQSKLFWMVPHRAAGYVMVNTTDPAAEFQSLSLSSSSELSCGSGKLGGAVLDSAARVAYSAPIFCNGFVGVHVDHRNLTVFKNWPTGSGYIFDQNRGDFHGTQFDGQKVWGIPFQQDHWVHLDPETGVMGSIGDMPVGYTGGANRFARASFDGRYIWAFPIDANMVMRVDTVSLTLKGIKRQVSGWIGGSAVDFEQHALWLCPVDTTVPGVVRLQFNTPTREAESSTASRSRSRSTESRTASPQLTMSAGNDTRDSITAGTRSATLTDLSLSRTITATEDSHRDKVSHSQERMSKTPYDYHQSIIGSSSSDSSESDLLPAENSSSLIVESPQDLGAVTNFVEQLLDSRTAAGVIVATGQASVVIAGVTVSSPLVATRAVRIGSVASILNSCSSVDAPDAVDAAETQLSYFELPFQLGVTIDGSKAGLALLGTTVLLVVAPWTVLLLIHRLRMVPLDAVTHKTAHQTSCCSADKATENGDEVKDGRYASIEKVQRKVVSVFCGMTFGYFAPAMVKYPMYFLLDKSSSSSLLVIGLFSFLTVLAVTTVSIYIVKTLERHSSTEASMGELPKGTEEKDDTSSSSVVSSTRTHVFTVSPGYLATTGFLYDGSRGMSRAYLRFYFVEEVIVSLLFGMLDGFAISTAFPHSACTGLAVAGLVLAVLHLAYVVGFRSYEDWVELLFSVLNAALLVSLTAAVLAAEVKYRSNKAAELELDIIGVLGIACFSTFFVQAVIMAILAYYWNSKKETLAQQEQAEAAKAAGLIKVWDQDEKTPSGTPSSSGRSVVSMTDRTEELGTALLSIVPERVSSTPSVDSNQQRKQYMSASTANPLQSNPLAR